MNSFSNFETRSLDLNLLNEMYAVPSSELPTARITEILSKVTGMKLDSIMVSTIFNNASLPLNKRAKVTPKVTEVKPKRVTKAENVAAILGLLGIAPVVNGEEVVETPVDEPTELTEQEEQYVEEVIENSRVESIYANQDGTDVAGNNQFGTGSRLGFN